MMINFLWLKAYYTYCKPELQILLALNS